MDSSPPLRVGFSPNPRLQPLIDGAVQVEGTELDIEVLHPADVHMRTMHDDAFDVFEASLSALLVARTRPHMAHLDWVALPLFLSKAFLQLEIRAHDEAGVRHWGDLRGKTFGVPDFDMTAAVWFRAMLRHLCDIAPSELTWVNGRRPENRHSTILQSPPPPDVRILEVDQVEAGSSLGRLLAKGVVHAAWGDYREADVEIGPTVHTLLDDAEGREMYRRFAEVIGTVPPNHIVMVQGRVIREQPHLARTLYDAFEASKQAAYVTSGEKQATRHGYDPYLLFLGDDPVRQAADFGVDPYPSGVAANRATISTLVDELRHEGKLDGQLGLEDLVAPQLLDT